MRRRRRRWSVLGVVAPLMLLTGGCKDDDTPSYRGVTVDDDESLAAPVIEPDQPDAGYATISDDEIVEAVKRELRRDGAVPRGVQVKSTYGIVTLEGEVDNLLAMQRATRIAEVVRGVKVVDNDMTVEAVDIDDRTLRRDVQQALLDDPAADNYELEVEVTDGHVTLSGTVQSYAELEHSERVVEGVRGVEAVTNDLIVEYVEPRLDPEIQQDVRERLRWDALVGHHLIDVEVEDGEVVLTGTVGSAAERRRAIRDAWVAGVEDVDGAGLDVRAWAGDEHLRRVAEPVIPDDDIAHAIGMAMAYDPHVLSFEIEPSVTAGAVVLRGRVDNVRAKLAAEELANNTVGVRSVDNQIVVESEGTPSDSALEQRIRSALARNPITESYEIDVSVHRGQATLTGTVDSFAELAEASEVTLGIVGVWKVDNDLVVDRTEPFVHDPFLYPYHPYVDTWSWYGAAAPLVSDADLAAEIRQELYWSPFVDEEQVVVSVSNGVARLTGTVDSWQEFRAATENALEGGAVSVDNELVVEYGD